MRWYEIIKESASVTDNARRYILDMLAPLKSQGASSVTAQQVLDQLNANDEFRGMNLDTDFIMDALKNVKGIRIEPDTDNGVMSIFFDEQSALRQVDKKQADKEKANINKAAMRTIHKNKG